MTAIERESRFQYHNKAHLVTLKDGKTMVGTISKVDYNKRTFLLLESGRPGMIGKDGREFAWDDCKSVRAETSGVQEGIYDDDMIPQWDRWARSSGVR